MLTIWTERIGQEGADDLLAEIQRELAGHGFLFRRQPGEARPWAKGMASSRDSLVGEVGGALPDIAETVQEWCRRTHNVYTMLDVDGDRVTLASDRNNDEALWHWLRRHESDRA